MKYSIFKLHFDSGIHIGKGKLSDGEMTIHADTLFSALCHEALNLGGNELLNKLINYVEENKLRLSDCMPYIKEDILFFPKPMTSPNVLKSAEPDRKIHKALKFISIDHFDDYMNGTLDLKEEKNVFNRHCGKYTVNTRASISEGEYAVPYSVGSWNFPETSGLYFIAKFESEDIKALLCDLTYSLSYSGIGGKRSSGLGKFTCTILDNIPNKASEMLEKESDLYMTVSTCMAADNELKAVLEGSKYLLEKRSGFILSETYSQTYKKKKDVYLFREGSCFEKHFDGLLIDVSNDGKHPVYRYAKSFLVGIM